MAFFFFGGFSGVDFDFVQCPDENLCETPTTTVRMRGAVGDGDGDGDGGGADVKSFTAASFAPFDKKRCYSYGKTLCKSVMLHK